MTKNIYDPNFEGFYVNVQAGEDLVTNPNEESTPDEILLYKSYDDNKDVWETQYLKKSNRTRAGKPLMTPEQIEELRVAMDKLQGHFKKVYRAQSDKNFAMDIEFKFDNNGKLVIKQARPWVD